MADGALSWRPTLLDGKPLTGMQTLPLPMDDTSKVQGWTMPRSKVRLPLWRRHQDRRAHRTSLDMRASGQGLRLSLRPRSWPPREIGSQQAAVLPCRCSASDNSVYNRPTTSIFKETPHA